MIEIDGTAIPLEPGKHYLLLYDANRIDHEVIHELVKFAHGSAIKICLVPISGSVNAVRLLQVEQPETLSQGPQEP